MRDVLRSRHVPDFTEHARWFFGTFTALRNIMKERESSQAAERPGTAGSGGSNESKNEDDVKALCKAVLADSFNALGESLQVLSWSEDLKFDITSLSLLSYANCRGNSHSNYRLGQENVVVFNDGAIVLSRYSDEWKSVRGIPPIVSLEVIYLFYH